MKKGPPGPTLSLFATAPAKGGVGGQGVGGRLNEN